MRFLPRDEWPMPVNVIRQLIQGELGNAAAATSLSYAGGSRDLEDEPDRLKVQLRHFFSDHEMKIVATFRIVPT